MKLVKVSKQKMVCVKLSFLNKLLKKIDHATNEAAVILHILVVYFKC